MKNRRFTITLGLALYALASAGACTPRATSHAASVDPRWVGAWAAAQQLVEPRNLPPQPGLTGSTLRQLVRGSIGGTRLRVRLSNVFGNGPLAIAAAHAALSAGGGNIRPGSDHALTFAGRPDVTIQAGASVLSDPLDFAIAPLADLAVTIRFGATPSGVTGHPGSRMTSYLAAAGAAAAPELPDAARTDHWYVLAGIDVVPAAPADAVVVLGNSITDGRGSTTNGNDRWPDVLAQRLRADEPARSGRLVAVLNVGIGGNKVVEDGGLGPPAMARLERDVFEQAGVRWLVVLEGVNDIGTARGAEASAAVARDLIDAYRQIVARAHARGLLVYGATILPFGGADYDSPEHEAARQAVNGWIRASGVFDAVIDTDAALRDPAKPSWLLPAADSGDHLHPSVAGHRLLAEAVDLRIFSERTPRAAAPRSARQ